MEFISGHHYHYELFKFLRVRGGVNFQVASLDHPLNPVNISNMMIKVTESITDPRAAGAPRFLENDEDYFLYTSLTENHQALDAFIASQMEKPADQRIFPYDVILRINGHIVKCLSSQLNGRRPNNTYDRYPVVKFAVEAPHWSTGDIRNFIRAMNDAGMSIPAERFNTTELVNASNWDFTEGLSRWTNTSTFIHNADWDEILNTLKVRNEHWRKIASFVCFYNSKQEEIRRAAEANRLRIERENQERRERAERERIERERTRVIEGVARAESRFKAFSNFAPKRDANKRSAYDNLQKFVNTTNLETISVKEDDASEVTPGASLEYSSGIELEIVASEKGVFIKNLVCPPNMVSKIVELLKTVKEE